MSLADLVRVGELRRLKICAAPDCEAALLDLSRNRSRMFCDTGNCGNRQHVAAYRERRLGRPTTLWMAEAFGAAPGLGCGDGRAGIAVGRAERPAIPVAPHGLCDPRLVDAGRGRSAARRIACVAGRLFARAGPAGRLRRDGGAAARRGAGRGATGDGTWSGALFVRVGEDLRPVANMASARLIPERTRTAACRRRRPAGTGIERAGAGIPVRRSASVSRSHPVTPHGRSATAPTGPPPSRSAHSRYPGIGAAHRCSRGRGARRGGVPAVRRRACRRRSRRSGHRAHSAPRRGPSAAGLFDTADFVPEAPPITAPHIAGTGGVSLVGGRTVGSVLRVARAGTEEYYVVLRDGLQRIGGLTADLIRFGDRGATEITTVAADLVAASPLVDTLPSASYPDRPPTLGALDGDLCATWAAGRVTIGTGSVVAGAAPVRLARATGRPRGRSGPDAPGTMRRCHGHRSRRSHRIGGALPHHRCRSSLRAA